MGKLLVCALLVSGAVASPASAWTWPVDGAVVAPFVTGSSPYAGGQHRGIDIAAPDGTPVRAPAAGVVSFAGTVPQGGKTLTVRTADGLAVTLLHLGSLAVRRGAVVAEGQTVATVGPSGDPEHDRPYVHLGIRRADDEHGYLDPLRVLPAATEPALQADPEAAATSAQPQPPPDPQLELAGSPAPTSAANVSAPVAELSAHVPASPAAHAVAGPVEGSSAAVAEGAESTTAATPVRRSALARRRAEHGQRSTASPARVPVPDEAAPREPGRAADGAPPTVAVARRTLRASAQQTFRADRARPPGPRAPRSAPSRGDSPLVAEHSAPKVAVRASQPGGGRWLPAGALVLLVLAGVAGPALRARRAPPARPAERPLARSVQAAPCPLGRRAPVPQPCRHRVERRGCVPLRQLASARHRRLPHAARRRRTPALT